MNLSGLSAAYPGYQAAESTSLDNQRVQLANEEAQNKLMGAQVLAKAIFGGQQPQAPQPPPGMPMAPPPGQASVAAPRPQGPPMGAPPMAPPGAPGPQTPPAGPGVIPQIDLQTLAQRIAQTSPEAIRNPAVMLAALERAAPILDRQSREDLAELRKEYQVKMLEQRSQFERQRSEDRRYGVDTRANTAATAEGGRNDRATTAEAGRNSRTELVEGGRNNRAETAEGGKNDRFQQREARLQAQSEVRQDQAWQRLALQRQALENRVREGGDRAALAEWRAVIDAQNRRAREIISSKNSLITWGKGERETLLKEQDAAYRAAIEGMKGVGAGRSGSQPAPTPPATPAVTASTPATSPATTLKPITPDMMMLLRKGIQSGQFTPEEAAAKARANGFDPAGL